MKKIMILILVLLTFSGCQKKDVLDKNSVNEQNNNSIDNIKKENKTMQIKIKDKIYTATLEDNATTNKLMEMLPLTLNMTELNNNEKYFMFDKSLPTNPYSPGSIKTGDIMLYQDNYLVLFYQDFKTNYQYTKIGKIDNPTDLESMVGNGNIEITFSK